MNADLLFYILTGPEGRRFREQMAQIQAIPPTPDVTLAALREAALAVADSFPPDDPYDCDHEWHDSLDSDGCCPRCGYGDDDA